MDLLCFFLSWIYYALWASVYLCLVVTWWERAGLLALICGVQEKKTQSSLAAETR